MGKTKPVWLVALQSAAEDMMGNRLLTREEFEASIDATLKKCAEEVKAGGTKAKRSRKMRIRMPMNIGPGEACPHCGRTEPRNRFG